jgi:hypothetical protein
VAKVQVHETETFVLLHLPRGYGWVRKLVWRGRCSREAGEMPGDPISRRCIRLLQARAHTDVTTLHGEKQLL